MFYLVRLLILVLLGALVYQDFKYREIYWILFPVTGIFLFIVGILQLSWIGYLKSSLINVGFVAVLLLLTAGIMSIKSPNCFSIKSSLGLGDVLFFVILCLMLSPVNMILFTCGGLFLTLLVYGVLQLFFMRFKEIPLAGALGLLSMIVISCELIYGRSVGMNDFFAHQLLMMIY